jgi:CubicO group peptidase (beta-lactamase class C family)
MIAPHGKTPKRIRPGHANPARLPRRPWSGSSPARRSLLLLALAASWATTACAFPEAWMVTGEPVSQQLAAFDEVMRTLMSEHAITAGELAVTWQGRLVLAHGYTLNPGANDIVVQPNSLMRIASNSKQVTSILINRLIQEKRLSLTDKISKFVDLAPPTGKSADPRLANITVRNLLEHLAGFGNYKGSDNIARDPMFSDAQIAHDVGAGLPVDQASIIRAMNGTPLDYPPGTTFQYSNYGYLLLGRIIEHVTGMSYEDYAASVFRPLGVRGMRLAHSSLAGRAPNEVGYHSGANAPSVMDDAQESVPYEYGGFNIENMDSHGGWTVSAVELVRIMSNLDNPSAVGAVLNQASVNRMFSTPQNYPYAQCQIGNAYYAEGWSVIDFCNGRRNTWHNGSLPSTTSYVVRAQDGWDYVMILNRRDETGLTDYSNEADNLMWNAHDAITQWPSGDLFTEELGKIFQNGFD